MTAIIIIAWVGLGILVALLVIGTIGKDDDGRD